MLEILFRDSGCLSESDSNLLHYSYHINRFDYPEMHRHVDYWEFCIVTDGEIQNCVTGRLPKNCPAGTVAVMTERDRHCLLKKSQAVRYINISVRRSHMARLLDGISPRLSEYFLAEPRYFRVRNALLEDIEGLLHGCNLLGEEESEEKEGLLCSAVLLLLQEINRLQLNVDGVTSPFLKKLLPLTQRREFLLFSVADLQKELNYSSSHLNRLFLTHFDMTAHEYLRRCKFRYACNLLLSTDMSMAEISAAIGYSNLSHFFENFKSYYGFTPGEYRKTAFRDSANI